MVITEKSREIIAIVQARMSSSRLPGKVLKKVAGKPLLQLQVERIKQSQKISRLVIATSDSDDDVAIAELAAELDVECFRGSLDDVLDRFYSAGQFYAKTPEAGVVRLTGDCPLMDGKLIDKLIDFWIETGADYVSNVAPPTFPDGLDIEVFSFKALERCHIETSSASHREHVTLYMRESDSFSRENFTADQNVSHLRFTVDEEKDYLFIQNIYNCLSNNEGEFSWLDVVELMDREPDLYEINQSIQRNEGLSKSLELERQKLS